MVQMLADGFLGVELDTEGKMLVGALDGFDDIHAIGRCHTGHPQGSSRHITHHLVMPRGHITDGVGTSNGKQV